MNELLRILMFRLPSNSNTCSLCSLQKKDETIGFGVKFSSSNSLRFALLRSSKSRGNGTGNSNLREEKTRERAFKLIELF